MTQKLPIGKDEFDPDALDVEYDPNKKGGQKYTGEQPPAGTILLGSVVRLWWTYAADNTPMIKLIFEADGNPGDLAEYDGLPVWENLTFKTSAAFKYQPWLEQMGLTLHDIANKTYVADEDDNVGAPIEKIGKWKPGEGSALCAITTGSEKYRGKWQTTVETWMDQDEVPEPDDDDPGGPEGDPDEEETEEETAPPARTRRTAAKPAARGTRAAPAASKPAAAKPAARGRAAASKPAAPRRGGRPAPAADDEVPF